MAGMQNMSKDPQAPMFIIPLLISMFRQNDGWKQNGLDIAQSLQIVEELKDGVGRLMEMDSKAFAENVAAMPPAQREQIQRIIDAATDGTLETTPTPTD